VIRIIRVAGIVAPGRIPESGVPVIPSPTEESDATVMLSPPTPVVPLGPVSPKGLVILALPILTALNLIVRSELRTRDRRIRFVCEIELPGLEPLCFCHPNASGYGCLSGRLLAKSGIYLGSDQIPIRVLQALLEGVGLAS